MTQKNPWLATRTRTGAEYDLPYLLREQAGSPEVILNGHPESGKLASVRQQSAYCSRKHA